MNDLTLSAIMLLLLCAAAEATAAVLILSYGWGRWLASTVFRLSWGVAVALLSFSAVLIPGAWLGIFTPLITYYWIVTGALLLWMGWDAYQRLHPLSGLCFRWLLLTSTVTGVVPLVHHWWPTLLQSAVMDGIAMAAYLRIVFALHSLAHEPRCHLLWRRDGTCRLEPQPAHAAFLVHHPELLLEIVERSTAPAVREPLLALLRARLGRAMYSPHPQWRWREADALPASPKRDLP